MSGEVVEARRGGVVVGETRRGDSAAGNAGIVMDAMEEHTETKGDTIAAVATDAMEEHTETKGDTTVAGLVAPVESIIEATKADEEEAVNRKGAAKVTNDKEDAGAIDAGNEEEVVIGVIGAGNEEGVVTSVVRGQWVDT
ncbi:hypothetical protein CBR_g55471 [Chara braunii]|uniref:Uncharacterized protein n=1 Tax=Chara braunii TaxID=69332 RepID=A0A388K7W3_CHABU|nr:hypothetical protein CBR_g55471 [Chara braunii]|eukprot:GBG66127.1 hypothetical protein CBR_g55471 [Chara braunii]